MIQAFQQLWPVVFVAAFFAAVTSRAVREESKAGALIALAAFLSFSLLTACALWRLL